jgi:hypothetical protein
MSVKETIKDAGQSVADAAKTAGKKIAKGADQATEWVKEKTGIGCEDRPDGIKEKMDVIGSCGNKLGVIDHVEGDQIKLTRKDSPDNQHHLIPLSWVSRVDSHVHLNRDCGEAKREWGSVS